MTEDEQKIIINKIRLKSWHLSSDTKFVAEYLRRQRSKPRTAAVHRSTKPAHENI